MQTISILLAFFIGCVTLLTVACALSIHTNQDVQEQQHQYQPSVVDDAALRAKRSLANKRFYDFGTRSVNSNDDDLQDFNDEYDRFRRFYDFGTKKRLARRFYDFGTKKRSSE